MRILGLPGIKPATFQWLSEIVDGLQLDARIQEYDCWRNEPSNKLDLGIEVPAAIDFEPELIIAKSIGTLIVLHTSREIQPSNGYVLIGIGKGFLDNDDRKAVIDLSQSDIPLLFIQQTSDPACSYRDLCELLGEDHNAKLVEMPGADHEYRNQDELVSIINSWIGHNVDTG
ncbi:MAG: hypothetical protein QF849_08700 [Pseudomonadales bacterium]|jgi:hypothetical protein|nr:hypothetical protein [Gammaproteobacteria bacterium]MDP6025940.1 hypothetical protein [Pseudomonadales bacterium]